MPIHSYCGKMLILIAFLVLDLISVYHPQPWDNRGGGGGGKAPGGGGGATCTFSTRMCVLKV